MAYTCVYKCLKYKAPHEIKNKRYQSGQKYCYQCNIFMIWDGVWCPCCNHKLRTTPRSRKNKVEFVRIG